jgi:hypothetical protein
MTILANGAFAGTSPNQRDGAPKWARTVLVLYINWKYHHIIAWEMLRDTWQGLLMCMWWLEIGIYIEVIGMRNSTLVVKSLKDGIMNDGDRQILFNKLSWPAWNIVEGPADRDDEGGSELDIFHHGITGNQKGRMNAINTLYQAMRKFLSYFNRHDMETNRVKNVNALESKNDPKIGTPKNVDNSHNELLEALKGMRPYKTSSIISYCNSM